MDKKIAGLLGAAAALTTLGSVNTASASASEPAPVTTYGDLLEPVPNALAALIADDAALAQQRPATTRVAQYHHHHHHHHHHHGYDPGAAIVGGVIGGIIGATQPHCYWTAGQPVWNGYAWVRPRVRVCQ
jgi:hypothetical protein